MPPVEYCNPSVLKKKHLNAFFYEIGELFRSVFLNKNRQLTTLYLPVHAPEKNNYSRKSHTQFSILLYRRQVEKSREGATNSGGLRVKCTAR